MPDSNESSKTRKLITRPLLAGAVAVTALSAVDAQAAIYLKLDGVPGESTNSKHKNEIDVLSFQFGLTSDQTLSASGAIRVSAPTCEGFSITKTLDKASPVLAGAVMTGKVMKTGVLSFTKASEKADAIFYTVTLTDVAVAGLTQSGRNDGVPSEEVQFVARQIELKYRPQSETGALGTEVKATLDCTSSGKI